VTDFIKQDLTDAVFEDVYLTRARIRWVPGCICWMRCASSGPEIWGITRSVSSMSKEAALLPWRIADAEQNLRQAEAVTAAEAAARG
jgi:hypothetical protein